MDQREKELLRVDLEAAQLLDLGVSPAIGLALLEENERLAKDAERYACLRMMDWFDGPLCVVRDPKALFQRGSNLGCDCPSRERLDSAIDAAMAKQGEK